MKMTTPRVTRMSPGLEKPFARSYWVIPNKLLAGAIPAPRNDWRLLKGFRGFSTVASGMSLT